MAPLQVPGSRRNLQAQGDINCSDVFERIIAEAFPDETAATRLQEIGLFALIYVLERDEEPLTAAPLARLTGLSEAQVHTHVQKLVDRKLVVRKKIKGPHGKRRSLRLSVKHTARTKRLIEMLDR